MKAKLITDKFDEWILTFPDGLIEELGWRLGDDIKIELCEMCELSGEHKGIALSNLTKNSDVIDGHN